uniref:Zinc finger protein, FOG family member 1 n=1 Tax=Kryptolebias marmoratus TaxID=37003 RepID=A0A3Q3EGN5_KRYMA
GEKLLASLFPPSSSSSSSSTMAQLSPLLSLVTQKQPAVKEEPLYPAALHSDIQLLPQQAGMAAILATAVVNKDIFPCKDCGIWYRSERNLQAHLMYYCASRQKQPAAASSPPQDKPKDSYPNERICPFPQCNKSCPSASSLEIHMRTHSGESFIPGDSGVVLKCQVCGHNSDSPAQLQQHVRTHLEVRVPAERSPTPRQSPPSSAEQPQLSPQEKEPPGSVPKPDSSSPGTNGGSATPPDFSPADADLKIKEEPQSESEAEEDREEEQPCPGEATKEEQTASASCQTSNSPKSPVTTTVKAEPTSPTPGSSPAPAVPGGAMFLPQYMFNPEAAILPQASEILAKMSEMVHSRLKHATPPHKGATCFECDITFNNINNYYAHKRLYCSSRHQGDGPSSGSGSVVPGPTPSSGPPGSSPQVRAASRADSASPTDSEPPEEEEEGKQTSEGSPSPVSGSAEDLEEDPNKTFCEACNIRFSRHENYTVHKRFYCASRHDPSNQRSVHAKASNAAAFLPQPIRTRKRKKMYEIHMARTEALANAAAAAATSAASAPSPSVLGLVVKQEVSPGGTGSSSPEVDGPIDLSKSSGGILPALPLTDYHKCTACSISFNSIENYLAHKTYYCPATTLQPHTLEQLHRLKRSASTSPKSRPQQERLDLLHPVEAKALPAEWVAQAKGASSSPRASGATSPSHMSAALAATPGAGAKGAGSALVVCPLASRAHRDSINGQARSGTASPVSPLLNGSPSVGGGSPLATSPLPVSPPRAASLTLSPVVASTHLPENTVPTAASHPAPAAGPKTPVISPVQNGNSRFCRLCNIKFSSLSTFIAHKKYYCSSHSAEHVK